MNGTDTNTAMRELETEHSPEEIKAKVKAAKLETQRRNHLTFRRIFR